MTNQEIIERWNTLLNPKRFRDTTGKKKINYKSGEYERIPFDSDYSRISLSAPFRRLQAKAQVFPLEKNDFARTRLTHSVEVSGLARSIGVSIENILLRNNLLDKTKQGHIPSILSVAGLIHDIGNPPFGHFGERTIQTFFKKHFSNESYNSPLLKKHLTKEEQSDLTNFDGNVQALRILLKLGLADDKYSFNLTMPSIASIIKYPKSSVDGNKSEWKDIGLEYKKFGFFQSEKNEFSVINNTLELNGHRHPLVYLLEAADDIAYSVSDIEDGCKKGSINWEILMDTFSSDKYKEDVKCEKISCRIQNLYKELTEKKFPHKLLLVAKECRIRIQIEMINDIVATFMDNHTKILRGDFKSELLKESESHLLRDLTEKLAQYNFNSKSVSKMELVGDNVITFLLNNFVDAVESDDRNNGKTKEGKLYNLISNHYKYIYDNSPYENDLYSRYLLVTDYISGMTDTYALTLYNELRGAL